MITDIIEYRQNHPTLTLDAIGKNFKVSRQYIFKVLKANNIPTKGAKGTKQTRYCLACNQMHIRRNRFCSDECHFKYKYMEVACAFCHVSFFRTRKMIDTRARLGYTYMYCSVACYYRGKGDTTWSSRLMTI